MERGQLAPSQGRNASKQHESRGQLLISSTDAILEGGKKREGGTRTMLTGCPWSFGCWQLCPQRNGCDAISDGSHIPPHWRVRDKKDDKWTSLVTLEAFQMERNRATA